VELIPWQIFMFGARKKPTALVFAMPYNNLKNLDLYFP
jgi:hypothetical protein